MEYIPQGGTLKTNCTFAKVIMFSGEEHKPPSRGLVAVFVNGVVIVLG